MLEYKCTSRIVRGVPCEHNCQVKCEVEPRGCLKYAVAEEWQEVVNDGKIAAPIDWNKLRKDFFKDNTRIRDVGTMTKHEIVEFKEMPHNIFEWFKKSIGE